MAKVNFSGEIELTDEILDEIAERVAGLIGGDAGGKGSKSSGKTTTGKASRRGKKDEGLDEEAAAEFAEQFEEIAGGKVSAAEFKKFAKENDFDYKSIGHVDPSDYEAVLEAAEDYFGEEEEEDSGEITVESVKEKCQELSKIDKDEMNEIFADFEIKSTRSLGKLSEEDLADLCEAVEEALADAG